MPKNKKEGKLTRWRSVPCPTCKAKAGDYCKGAGIKAASTQKVTKTWVHRARQMEAEQRFKPLSNISDSTTERGRWTAQAVRAMEVKAQVSEKPLPLADTRLYQMATQILKDEPALTYISLATNEYRIRADRTSPAITMVSIIDRRVGPLATADEE